MTSNTPKAGRPRPAHCALCAYRFQVIGTDDPPADIVPCGNAGGRLGDRCHYPEIDAEHVAPWAQELWEEHKQAHAAGEDVPNVDTPPTGDPVDNIAAMFNLPRNIVELRPVDETDAADLTLTMIAAIRQEFDRRRAQHRPIPSDRAVMMAFALASNVIMESVDRSIIGAGTNPAVAAYLRYLLAMSVIGFTLDPSDEGGAFPPAIVGEYAQRTTANAQAAIREEVEQQPPPAPIGHNNGRHRAHRRRRRPGRAH